MTEAMGVVNVSGVRGFLCSEPDLWISGIRKDRGRGDGVGKILLVDHPVIAILASLSSSKVAPLVTVK